MRRARLITWQCARVDHPRFITLTNCPRDWQQRRAQVRDLARRIRERWACEWIWTTEVGKNPDTLPHVHAIQHGQYIPQRALQQLWGDRRADIRSASPKHGEYISKSARAVSQYISKSAHTLDQALTLNNGRLHHWSRGFFGGPIRDAQRRMASDVERDLLLVSDRDGSFRAGTRWIDAESGASLSVITETV